MLGFQLLPLLHDGRVLGLFLLLTLCFFLLFHSSVIISLNSRILLFPNICLFLRRCLLILFLVILSMFFLILIGGDLRFLLHLGFINLLFRCSLLLCLSFLQDVSKQGCCKMFLILVFVFGYPHPLPLAWRYHTRLQLVCAINGDCTQNDIVLCLEHVHFLYAVHVHLVVLTAAKQVHLQIRLCLCHRIVFLCQFHSQTVHRVLRLFQRGEEAV